MTFPRAFALATALLLAAPLAASAQDRDRATFDDSAQGWMWAAGIFEVGTLLSLLAMPISDCHGSDCPTIAAIGTSASLVLAIVGGLITSAAETPSDVPLVVHHSLWPGIAALALTAGLKEDFDSGSDEPVLLIGLPTAIALGAGVYTFSRRDDLLRNPDVAPATHLATWAPWTLGMLVATIVAVIADDPEVVAPIAGALMGIATYAVGVAMIEDSR